MKTFLFIMLQFKIGGTEKVFTNISDMIDAPIYLFLVHNNIDKEIYDKINLNVQVITPNDIPILKHLVRFSKYKYLKFFIDIVVLLSEYIYLLCRFRKQKLCIINFSDTLSTLFLTVMLSIKNNNVYSWIHCSPKMLLNSKSHLLYKYLLKKCDKIVCICNEQKEELLKIFKFHTNSSKIAVMYNPVNINKIKEKSIEHLDFKSKFILSVARLDLRSKDFHTLIEAYDNLSSNIKRSYSLVIIGDGPDYNIINNYIIEKKLDNNVFLIGKKANPYKWMKKCSLFILSSKNEGLPTVIIEAMACGAVIISTDCLTGPKEILENGKSGLLVPVGNKEKMSETIKLVLNKEIDINKLLESAQKRVYDFSLETIKLELNKILHSNN